MGDDLRLCLGNNHLMVKFFFVCVVYGQKKQAKGKEWEERKKKKKKIKIKKKETTDRIADHVCDPGNQFSGCLGARYLTFFFFLMFRFSNFPIFALRVGSHFPFLLL